MTTITIPQVATKDARKEITEELAKLGYKADFSANHAEWTDCVAMGADGHQISLVVDRVLRARKPMSLR